MSPKTTSTASKIDLVSFAPAFASLARSIANETISRLTSKATETTSSSSSSSFTFTFTFTSFLLSPRSCFSLCFSLITFFACSIECHAGPHPSSKSVRIFVPFSPSSAYSWCKASTSLVKSRNPPNACAYTSGWEYTDAPPFDESSSSTTTSFPPRRRPSSPSLLSSSQLAAAFPTTTKEMFLVLVLLCSITTTSSRLPIILLLLEGKKPNAAAAALDIDIVVLARLDCPGAKARILSTYVCMYSSRTYSVY